MYQPYEDSNVFKRLRQNILEKKYFSYFFFLYFARVQNLKKTRARGAKHKYELDRPKRKNKQRSAILKNTRKICFTRKKNFETFFKKVLFES